MRVVSIIESLLHGGAETVLVDLVQNLAGHTHQVVHFTGRHGATPAPWIVKALERAGARCDDIQPGALASTESRCALLHGEVDAVLHHWWGYASWAPWATEAGDSTTGDGLPGRRPRFVLIAHTSRFPVPTGYDAYVLVSASQRPLTEGIDPARVHVIPNGVDLARFADASVAPQSLRPFTVGRLSNLRPEKIPADWVATATGYGLSDSRFVIAGDGVLRHALEADVQRLGVERQFSLPGYVERDAVPRLLATFDVFCYTVSTAVECHPLALLEACAAGLPIVAEHRGGVPDVVEHGVNGFLAQTSAEIGSFLRLLREDRALGRRLGAAGRDRAGGFSLARQAAAYEHLLQTLQHQMIA